MATATELRTQRAAVIAASRAIVEKAETDKRELTAEEDGNFKKAVADATKLGKEIEAAERREWLDAEEADQRASQGRRTGGASRTIGHEPTAHDVSESVRAWALAGTERAVTDPDALHKAATCGVKVAAPTLSIRALSKGTTTAGGHTVPVNMANTLERQLKFYAPIRAIAGSLVTDGGADFDYPRATDTANSASIVGEAGTITAATDPTFDKVTFKAWKYATTIVKVSLELLQDSAIDVPTLLMEMLGERMGRGQATHMVTGNGTTQPEGMATGAAVANALAANALTVDKIVDLIYSVDRAYRAGAAFVMHDETLAGFVKVKDTTGQYLLQPSVQAGEPDRIRGYPVALTNDITSINSPGTTQKLVLFGNPKKYLVRDIRGSQQMTRLNELYAATGEVGFVLLMRTDARFVGHSGCVKALTTT